MSSYLLSGSPLIKLAKGCKFKFLLTVFWLNCLDASRIVDVSNWTSVKGYDCSNHGVRLMDGKFSVLDCSRLPGLFNEKTGVCDKRFQDCFMAPEQSECLYPHESVGRSKCIIPEKMKAAQDYCSINTPGPLCKLIGDQTDLPYVVDLDGIKTYVRNLVIKTKDRVSLHNVEILTATTNLTSESDIRDFAHLSNVVNCVGDVEGYVRALDMDCISSSGAVALRPCKFNYYTLTTEVCDLNILCYGHERVKVFAYMEKVYVFDQNLVKIICEGSHVKITSLPDEVDSIRLCGTSSCKTLSVEHAFSKQYYRGMMDSVTDSDVEIDFLVNREVVHSTIVPCKSLQFCENIECTLCVERMLNHTCWSYLEYLLFIALLLISAMLLSILVTIFRPIFKVLRCACFLCRKLSKVFYSKGYTRLDSQVRYLNDLANEQVLIDLIEQKDSAENETSRPVRSSRSYFQPVLPKLNFVGRERRRRVNFLLMLIGALTLNGVDGVCQITNVMQGTLQSCNKISGKCQLKYTYESELAPSTAESCLLVRDKLGNVLEEVSIRTNSVRLKCAKRVLYYTRDVVWKVSSERRCSGSGWCLSSSSCNDVKPDGFLPFMFSIVANRMGRTYCLTSPGCAANGCFYCTEGCFAYRWYATSGSKDIHEVSECVAWVPEANITVTRSSQGKIDVETIHLIHNDKHQTGQLSFQVKLFPTKILSPLGQQFVCAGSGLCVLTNASPPGQQLKGTIGQVQCPSVKTAEEMSRCDFASDICLCNRLGDNIACDCSRPDLNLQSNPNKLPLNIDDAILRINDGVIYAETSGAVSGSIIIDGNNEINQELEPVPECHFQLVHVSGCYNCLTGAKITYECRSTKTFTSTLDCGNWQPRIKCQSADEESTVNLLSPSALLYESCYAACDAKKVEILIKATLKFIPFYQISNTTRMLVLSSNSSEPISINWLWSGFSFYGLVIKILVGFLIILTLIIMLKFLWYVTKKKVSHSRQK